MDQKQIEEIKAHTEMAREEGFGLQQFDDLDTLIAEVERLTAENERFYGLAEKMNVVDLVRENCRLANQLNGAEIDVSIQKEHNATLKKAYKLIAIAYGKYYAPYSTPEERSKLLPQHMEYFMEQAQQQTNGEAEK